MKKIVFSVLFSIAFTCVIAQVKFERVYGGSGYDQGYSVTQTYDGGYAAVGSTTSIGNGSTDAYLVKIDSMGVIRWQRSFGWINIDQAYSVKETADSGLVIAGYTNSYGHGGYDMYLIKTDSLGDTLWTKTYGGTNWDFAYSVAQTTDGGYVLAGGTYSFGSGSEDMYLVRLNAVGDTVWTKTFGGTGDDEAQSVKQTFDGGFILTGFTKSFGDLNGDVYTVRTDINGDTLWTKTYGTAGSDYGTSISQTADSSFISSAVSENVAGGYNLAFLIKTTAAGDTTFTKKYGAPNDAAAYDIIQTIDGGYIWVGKLKLGTRYDVYLFKMDAGGWFTFAHTFGGLAGDDEGRSIEQTPDGGYVVAGNSKSFNNGLGDVYVFKTDNAGTASGTIVNNATGILEQITDQKNGHLNVYPNPSNGSSFINFSPYHKTKKFDLCIANTLGQIVMKKEVANYSVFGDNCEFELDLSTVPSGMYFIRLSSSEEVFSSKLMIEK